MTTKRDLANAIIKANEIREASYKDGNYSKSLDDACNEACRDVDPDLAEIVSCLLTAGYGESWDWALKHKG